MAAGLLDLVVEALALTLRCTRPTGTLFDLYKLENKFNDIFIRDFNAVYFLPFWGSDVSIQQTGQILNVQHLGVVVRVTALSRTLIMRNYFFNHYKRLYGTKNTHLFFQSARATAFFITL